MAFSRTGIAAGQTAQSSQLLQLIQALEGDSGSGQPIALTALSSGSAYALDVRNLGAGGALRVRDTTGNQSLAFADQTLTYALGEITSDGGLRLTATWNAGGVTFTGLKLNVTNTSSAAASLLADLQIGGSSMWKVTRAGAVTQASALTVTAGGATITAGGLTVTAGGATVTAGDLTMTDGSITVVAAARTIQNAGDYLPTTAGTTMTAGFTYVPSAGGAPTGDPANGTVNRAPLYYDSTNNRLYVHDEVEGAWKSVAVA